MTFWKNPEDNSIHDDMGGLALSLPSWPSGLVMITDEEAESIRQKIEIPKKTRFSSLEFLDRFTDEEQISVATATMSNAQVKLWYDKLLAAEYIDITDPRTIGGVDALISSGLLDESRKDAVLAPE